MRWTLEGSSWGRRGSRHAGAVVKGVGMAVELLVTAAAGLVKDLGVRLVGLGAIVVLEECIVVWPGLVVAGCGRGVWDGRKLIGWERGKR